MDTNYVFGPEDGSLNASIKADLKYIVQIPSNGCLNLGVAASIIMFSVDSSQERS